MQENLLILIYLLRTSPEIFIDENIFYHSFHKLLCNIL